MYSISALELNCGVNSISLHILKSYAESLGLEPMNVHFGDGPHADVIVCRDMELLNITGYQTYVLTSPDDYTLCGATVTVQIEVVKL